MFCSRVRKRLVAYVDNELSEKARLAIESHINKCPDCRRELTGISSINTLLNQVPQVKVPFAFSTSILERLIKQEAQAPQWVRIPELMPMPAFAQVGVLIITIGVILSGLHLGSLMSLHRYNKDNGMNHLAEFSEMPSSSVEGEYFELMLALH